MNKFYLLLIFILLLIQSCKTTSTPKNKILVETLSPEHKTALENKIDTKELETSKIVRTDKISNFLKDANSIKIFSYSIESPDFATQLFKEKLKGKEIEILLSKFSTQNYRSKINYLKQIDLEPKLIALPPQLENKSFIILDDNVVLKNIFIPLNHNMDTVMESLKIENEIALFESCKLSPQNCFKNFKPIMIQKESKKQEKLNFVLPSKTKKEKFLDSD